jgi:hypothetical protein
VGCQTKPGLTRGAHSHDNIAHLSHAASSIGFIRDLLESAGEIETQDRLLKAPITTAEQTYFWTSEWQAGEKEVDEAIQDSRYETFNSMDEMLEFVDKQ